MKVGGEFGLQPPVGNQGRAQNHVLAQLEAQDPDFRWRNREDVAEHPWMDGADVDVRGVVGRNGIG